MSVNAKPLYLDENESYTRRSEDLVQRMSLEECASQLRYDAPGIDRLGIKAYNWWNEALHGVARAGTATVFPQAINLAATFDPDFVRNIAGTIALEGRAKYELAQAAGDYGIYKGLTFWSPNINIFRDPRWGRGQETFGEDPYLTGKLGCAFVSGLEQGPNKSSANSQDTALYCSACVKHFAVHSGPEPLRHEFDAKASARDLAETYLPAFYEVIRNGVSGLMGAYNRVNGEVACGSPWLLTDLLRDSWGFKGYVTSDCWAISDFYQFHRVTENATDSAALALNAGCDLNCGTAYQHVMQAYDAGLLEEKTIREACRRVMEIRLRLGEFDEKISCQTRGVEDIASPEHLNLAEEAAWRSCVLLKNDGLLPLDEKRIKKIAVIGPNAHSERVLLGNYHGTSALPVTLLQGLRQRFSEASLRYSEGCHLYLPSLEELSPVSDRLSEAKAFGLWADVIVLCVGLDERIEGEEIKEIEGYDGDRGSLHLPVTQQALVEAIAALGKPWILINMSGSMMDLSIAKGASAILHAGYPGEAGGLALAKILAGDVSPSGKLPITFYRADADLPDFSDYGMRGRTYRFSEAKDWLYPFGFGLSYADYEVKTCEVLGEEKVQLRVKIERNGDFAHRASSCIQVYARPEKEGEDLEQDVSGTNYDGAFDRLVAICPVELDAGETKIVTIPLDPEAFREVDADGRIHLGRGRWKLRVGLSLGDAKSLELGASPSTSCTVQFGAAHERCWVWPLSSRGEIQGAK